MVSTFKNNWQVSIIRHLTPFLFILTSLFLLLFQSLPASQAALEPSLELTSDDSELQNISNNNALLASTLELSKTASVTTELSGQEFTYLIRYSCASTTENCDDMTVTDVLPPELSHATADVVMQGSNHISGTNYDSASGTATWIFDNPLPAGSTGELELRVKFQEGSTPNNTPAINTAQIQASNAPTVTSSVTVTGTAQSQWTLNKSVGRGGAVDEDTIYSINLCDPAGGNIGGLNLSDIVVTDTLPVGAVWVNGGTYDPATHQVVITTFPDRVVQAGNFCISRGITVQFPSSTFAIGDVVTNNVDLSGILPGNVPLTLTDQLTHTLLAPAPQLHFDKGGDNEGIVGQTVDYYFSTRNDGNVPLDSVVITDSIPSQLEVTHIRTGNPNGLTNFPMTITYQSNLTSTWLTVPGSPFTTGPQQEVDVSTMGLAANEYITALRWEYGPISLFFIDFGQDASGFAATVLATDRNGDPVNDGDVITNIGEVEYAYNDISIVDSNDQTTTVVGAESEPQTGKTIVGSNEAIPGNTVTYRLELNNDSNNNSTGTLINPVIADFLNDNLEYVAGSWSISSAPSGTPSPIFEELSNYNSTGRTLLRWRWDGTSAHTFAIGEIVQIDFQVRIKEGTPPGTIDNYLNLIESDNSSISFDSCGSAVADSNDYDGDGDSSETICRSTSPALTVKNSTAMESLKLVRGQLDSDWTKYPNSGLSVPGGSADYQIVITNTGNISMTNLVVIDILPFVTGGGITETGVIDLSDRESEWRPSLIAPVSAPAGVTVSYSTEKNPCRTEMLSGGPVGCSPPNWSTVPPTDITTVQSLRFDFGETVLNPLDSMALTWSMRAPLDAPDQGEIAWNSFGYVADRVDTGDSLLPSEPIKVGIALTETMPANYGNYVWVDANNNGSQDEPLATAGLNGVRVELYEDDGDGIADPASDSLIGFTITMSDTNGNPGYYQFTNLPAGNYFARFYPPTGYNMTSQNAGDDALDSDADPTTGLTAITDLIVGEIDYTWDMGLVNSTTASVGNYVWFDQDNDGSQDESTADGINGVTVNLYLDTDGDGISEPGGDDGAPISTTLTIDDVYGNPGYYIFSGLPPADYFVEFVLPTGATFTAQGATGSSDATDSDPDTTGATEVFTLIAGQYDDSWDAGMILPAGTLSLGDRVWNDSDNDGLYERAAGETGIDGVRVNLYRDNDGDGIADADEYVTMATTFTSGGEPGYYEFTNLPAGDYIVEIDDLNFTSSGVLNGMQSSTGNGVAPDPDDDVNHDDNGEPSGNSVVSQPITLADGTEPINDGDSDNNSNKTVDFGFTHPQSIGDRVWLDQDVDGIQDAGEPGIAGVVVNLYDSSNTIIASATTDLAGNYLFNVPVGNYYVGFEQPTGYLFTSQNVGDDALDSDADPTTGLTSQTTISSGENDLTWDAGFYLPAAIGNYVWIDENSDGYQDAGEPGIPNVIVTLTYYGSDGALGGTDDVVYTTTTDANGGYLFDGLPAGNYQVDVDDTSLPNGLSQSTLVNANVDFGNQTDPYTLSVSAGDENLTADFGYNWGDANGNTGNGALGDRIWVDSDGDGVQDPGESGLAGVTVTIYHDPDGNGVFDTPYTAAVDQNGNTGTGSTTTEADGSYIFHSLPAGAYVVVVDNTTLPIGYSQTGDPDHFNANASTAPTGSAGDHQTTSPVVLAPGDVFLNVDFGYQPTASYNIGDTIWFDVDGDGIYEPNGNDSSAGTSSDNEYGIAGVTVALLDSSGNIIATTTTDENGNYLFTGLPNGTYSVWVNDTNNILGELVQSGDPDAIRDNMSTVTLADADNLEQDFGYTPPTQSSTTGLIGDTIFLDRDNDGLPDAGEGIEGVVVILTNSQGITVTSSTDENGQYSFGSLPAGTYTVTVDTTTLPVGVTHSVDPDDDGVNDNGDENDQSVVTIGAGGINLDQDFGYVAATPHRLGNLVWTDLDADGTYEPADGETPIGGVTVDLYRDLNGNDVVDVGEPLIATTVTSASIDTATYGTNGNYIFEGLPDGDYIVDVSDRDGLLAGYWHSNGADAGDGTTDDNSQLDPYAVTINGADNLTADFGYYVLPAAVGNYVWEDSDRDGLQDSDESGIPNVVVTLVIGYPDGTNITLSTLTDATGHYSFTNLLLDEDYNGDGAGEPTFTISVDTTQAALSGVSITTINVNSNVNDFQDSDNPAGVTAEPTQGQTNTDAVDPVTNESVIASYDFGFSSNTVGTIGNYIWVDENSDGLQDAGEPGIPNVIVNLTNSSGTVFTTTTDASGHYLFADLSTDTYTVTIPALNSGVGGALEGMTQSSSYPNPGSDLNNQNLNGGSGYVITLGAGEENLTADFGYNYNPTTDVDNPTGNPTAALGDRIWVDVDGDGVQDPNEIGVEGMTVNLYSDLDGDGVYDTPAGSTTTDANGNYLFDGLTPAGYVVEVVTTGSPVDGWTQSGDPDEFGSTASSPDNRTTNPIVLAPGDVFLNADFGYTPPANATGSIGDTVWFDADASATATIDGGEYGIAGVTVALIKDSNGDGIWTALGADGLPGTADDEPIIGSDSTDSNGNYLFSGLPLDDGDGDADYLVWVNDTDNVLGSLVQTYDADGTGTSDISATAISSGTRNVLDQDFSYTPNGHTNGQGLIGDTIFRDDDGNSTPDDGEGLEGVTVTLTDASGNVISTITDENGHYWFGNLDPNGTYTVTVDTNTLPGGLTNSVDPDGGTANLSIIDLSADPDGTNDGINLGQDFGYTPAGTAGSIGNLVWLDQNADGINNGVNGPDSIANTDDDETGIPGVTIDLYHDVNGNGQVDAGEPLMGSSTTDATGNYLFSNLPVDDGSGDMAYVVDVTDEAGVLAGYWHSLGDQVQTSNDTSKSDSYPVTLTDADGERDVLTVDFGYYVEPAAVGNYVWYDENNDGLQDSDESGISGIPVTLTISYPNNDPITLVTTTDMSGSYSFDNLLLDEDYNDAGSGQEPTYSISVGIPTGYTAASVDAAGGTNDRNDSDNHSGVSAQPVQGQTDTTAVNPVTNEPLIASYDFGLISTLDFGDLPASYSATMLSDDGPRHTVGSLYLGATVDVDRDGEPNDSAMGDDDLDGNDDEDGLIPTNGVKWQVGTDSASIDVSVTGTGGVLSLWIDWNQDGDFDEANEKILLDRSVTAGNQTIAFDVPSGVSFNGDLNLRARLYDATTNGNASPIGYSGGVGEVEDYQWNFAALSVNLATFQATCQSSQVMITWESVSELNNLGFNVYRSSSTDGPEVQLNDSLIPSQVPGSGAGAYYEWIDNDIDNNSPYYYWIEDLDTGGTTSLHGPVSATCGTSESGMIQIYLPVIQR